MMIQIIRLCLKNIRCVNTKSLKIAFSLALQIKHDLILFQGGVWPLGGYGTSFGVFDVVGVLCETVVSRRHLG